MEGEREGKHLAAAVAACRHFRPHHSVCQLLAPVGFQAWLPHPCHSAAAMHAPTACVCERNWSVWGQALLKAQACFGTRMEADLHLLQHWATWSPAYFLPNKMKRMQIIEQLGR